LGIPAGVAVVALDALIAERRVVAEHAVNAVAGILGEVVKEAILVCFGGNVEIAVFLVVAVVAVVAVLAIGNSNPPMGYSVVKFDPLRKEWLGRIERSPMIQCIPLVTMPRVLLKYGKYHVRWIHGNEFLAGEITLPSVERSVIPPRHPSLHPTLRTVRGRWNELLFAIESRRDVREELQVTVGDLEAIATGITCLLHW